MGPPPAGYASWGAWAERLGVSDTGASRNPLTGLPLLPGQILVTGPVTTGPRVTVTTVAGPWPPWVTSDGDGYPEDLGTIPGGTWDGSSGAQSLPPLVVTGSPSLWVIVAAIVAYVLLFGKRSSRGEW